LSSPKASIRESSSPTHPPEDTIDKFERLSQPALPHNLVARRRGQIGFVELARPAKRNALNIETIDGLATFFGNMPEGMRVVILHCAGAHFSAGADLSAFGESRANSSAHAFDAIQFSRRWHRAFETVESCGVPVISVLKGAVIGGGLELAASTHIRIAERCAFYGLPESARGIFVGGGGAVRIPRLIGTPRMVDMMLTGRTYTAEEGLSLGFSQYVVDQGQGMTQAVDLAAKIVSNTTLSNFAVTNALPRIARSDPDTGLLMESLMAAITLGDEDVEARMVAFLTKRGAKAEPG
jgi:enoyl-CoA hydratase/carnithine racemase